MSRETVLEERSGGVAVLTMNRPDKKNAFNDRQYDDLRDALRSARGDSGAKAVVITGAGDAFSAGQDISEMGAPPSHGDGEAHGFTPFVDELGSFDKPLLAAVEGVAVGIGLTMLLHCDIVYVGRSARLRAPFVSLGLVPEAGSSLLLQEVIGPQRAAEVLYTSEWIDGERAVELGLAAEAVEDGSVLERATERAKEIAEQPLTALQRTKRLLLEVRSEALAAARRREDASMAASLGSAANHEAIRAFREKRKADFTGM